MDSYVRLVLAVTAVCLAGGVTGQCPWDGGGRPELASSCVCAYSQQGRLSVQCHSVSLNMVAGALRGGQPLDLLYIHNSSLGTLSSTIFRDLGVVNLQLSSCRITEISTGALAPLQNTLKSLHLQDNLLTEVPVDALRPLKNITSLDLSKNRIVTVPDNAFATLTKLSTLKLNDNNVTLSKYAFRGLETSLKNLNLKGTKQKTVPDAVKGLASLAFLDLSANGLRGLPGKGEFQGLSSLAALNLERNVLQALGSDAFIPLSQTLTSLSLLNNLLTEFPTVAIRPLRQLRVLDIGFNLLTEVPRDAFSGNPGLTLLAVDGNPLSTLEGVTVAHLNSTLRGLSLGGRFLHCDCRLRWVAQWVRRGDLQVTSRETHPQYCGTPPTLANRNFYNIQPSELVCGKDVEEEEEPVAGVGFAIPEEVLETAESPSEDDSAGVGEVLPSSEEITTKPPPSSEVPPPSTAGTTRTASTIRSTTTTTRPSTTPPTSAVTSTTQVTTAKLPSSVIGKINSTRRLPTRPPLILSPRNKDLVLTSAHRYFTQDNSVIIQWESETANIVGFRVVYRLFGDKSFKQGPPLDASEREFKIKNVPSQECIVVCVVLLDEVRVTVDSVPWTQCREVRTGQGSSGPGADRLTLAAGAAVCGLVVLAVVVVVMASRRRARKLHTLDGGSSPGGLALVGGLPVACCPSAGSPGPVSSLAQLNAFTTHKDWDQISVYSNRSPRPLSYIDRHGSIRDDMRSQISTKGSKTRSAGDGQSQHSYSQSSRYLGVNGFSSQCLVNTRPELRQSRQSVAVSERASNNGGRRRSRSARESSRSRHSQASLNYPGDTSDNWTDHDLDIYTTHHGRRNTLVPL